MEVIDHKDAGQFLHATRTLLDRAEAENNLILGKLLAWSDRSPDLANPSSNHIYQHIGYQPVCDAQMWQLSHS